jgi:hypothetical protein
MTKILKTILFITLNNILIYSQTFEGVVKDSLTNDNVIFISISNITKDVYTFSDENGFFSIPASLGDTLNFSNINYIDYNIILSNLNDSEAILLQPKNNLLEEVVVIHENDSYNIGYKKGKKKHKMGVPINSFLALRINNDRKIKIEKIEIPVFFDDKFEYDNEGFFELQLFKSNQGVLENLVPISKRYYTKVQDNMKFITFMFEEETNIPDTDFYIIFNRVLPDNVYDGKKMFTINPCLYFKKKGVKGDLFIKNIFADEWVDYQDILKKYSPTQGPTPLFSFEITVKEIN